MKRIIALITIISFCISLNAQQVSFDKKYPYYEGLAAVVKGDKWGFVNEANEIVIPLMYDDVGFFYLGYTMVYESKNINGEIWTIPYIINKNNQKVPNTEEYTEKSDKEDASGSVLYYLYNPVNKEEYYESFENGILKNPINK